MVVSLIIVGEVIPPLVIAFDPRPELAVDSPSASVPSLGLISNLAMCA